MSSQLLEKNPALTASEISTLVAQQWRAEPPNVKEHWTSLAAEENRKHKEKYPGYKYCAVRPIKGGGVTKSRPGAGSSRGGRGSASPGKKASQVSSPEEQMDTTEVGGHLASETGDQATSSQTDMYGPEYPQMRMLIQAAFPKDQMDTAESGGEMVSETGNQSVSPQTGVYGPAYPHMGMMQGPSAMMDTTPEQTYQYVQPFPQTAYQDYQVPTGYEMYATPEEQVGTIPASQMALDPEEMVGNQVSESTLLAGWGIDPNMYTDMVSEFIPGIEF